jgi:hypothetical protein
VRENLKVVPAGSALQERYLKALGEQEDRIAAIAKQLTSEREALARAKEALASYVRDLRLGP